MLGIKTREDIIYSQCLRYLQDHQCQICGDNIEVTRCVSNNLLVMCKYCNCGFLICVNGDVQVRIRDSFTHFVELHEKGKYLWKLADSIYNIDKAISTSKDRVLKIEKPKER